MKKLLTSLFERAAGIDATSTETHSGTCGANLTWTLVGRALFISGTGAMDDYEESSPWNKYPFKTVVISDGVTSIGDWAFYGCKSVTSVTIGNDVTSIGHWAFRDCSSLTSITIGKRIINIGDLAFLECELLTSVHISDISAWCQIVFEGYYANPFSYANNLYLNGQLVTDLVIPDDVTSIGEGAFQSCTSLTSITIPNSVTSIGDMAFLGCESLTSVTIGNGLKTIGQDAFRYCYKLIKLYCHAIMPPKVDKSSFLHHHAFLYVPCESKKAYAEDEVWGNFKYIECIPESDCKH